MYGYWFHRLQQANGGNLPMTVGQCQFMACRAMGSHFRFWDAVDGEREAIACNEHNTLLREAEGKKLRIMLTPPEDGSQWGTLWINTIGDFWYGRRKPFLEGEHPK